MPRGAVAPVWHRDPVQFGIFSLCRKRLARGVLSCQHVSGSNVKGYGVQDVAPRVRDVLQLLVDEQDDEAVRRGRKLTAKQREWLSKFCTKARVAVPKALVDVVDEVDGDERDDEAKEAKEDGGGFVSDDGDSDVSDEDESPCDVDALKAKFTIAAGEWRDNNRCSEVLTELRECIAEMVTRRIITAGVANELREQFGV